MAKKPLKPPVIQPQRERLQEGYVPPAPPPKEKRGYVPPPPPKKGKK